MIASVSFHFQRLAHFYHFTAAVFGSILRRSMLFWSAYDFVRNYF
jgi:hypothetical protein